jgi:hypothetical protein
MWGHIPVYVEALAPLSLIAVAHDMLFSLGGDKIEWNLE